MNEAKAYSNSAQCETVLPDGRFIVVQAHAVRYENSQVEPFKIKTAHPQRMLAALLSARMSEQRYDAAHKVTLECRDQISELDAPLVELAAILADRRARGLNGSAAPRTIVLGWSADWVEGVIAAPERDRYQQCLRAIADRADLGHVEIVLPAAPDEAYEQLYEQLQLKHPDATLHEIDSLASLHGHPTPGADASRATVWFPVVMNEEFLKEEKQECLLPLEVVVRRRGQTNRGGGERIEIVGLEKTDSKRAQIVSLIHAMRERDRHGCGEWHTLVRVPPQIQQESFEFALVLADRMARGREFVGHGETIATGLMQLGPDGEPNGYVGDVAGVEHKCATILTHLKARAKLDQPGPPVRILLPQSWRERVSRDFVSMVQQAGSSCAFIGRLRSV